MLERKRLKQQKDLDADKSGSESEDSNDEQMEA